MQSVRFFWKSFLSFVAVISVSSIVFGIFLYRHFYATTLSNLEFNLKKETEALAGIAMNSDVLKHPETMAKMVHTDDRITILLTDGTVIADNWAQRLGIEAIENHANRPEFQAALKSTPIFARRVSRTVKTEMLYYAVPLRQDGKIVSVLRLSFPLTNFYSQMDDIRTFLFYGGFFALLLSLPFAYLLSRSTTSSIEQLRSGAGRLAAGDLNERVHISGSIEFQELARDFNRMAEELQHKIASLQQEYSQRETLFSRMVEGVLALDKNGKAIYANEAFCAMVGSRINKVQGRSFLEISRSDALSDYISELIQSDSGSVPDAKEIRFFLPEGESIYSVQTTRIMEGEGTSAALLFVFHDITSIKRLDQIRKDFVANVSHELRTPLTAIRGSIEILLDGALLNPDEAKKFLEIMDKQLRNIQNVVSDMLKLASVEDGRTINRREMVEVSTLVDDVITVVQPLAAKKKQELKIQVPDSLILLSIDPMQISDALMNVLDNAVKYTDENGKITFRVSLQDDEVIFQISDNGPGISREQLPRIFERFYRVDKSRSREMGGTGLGLSIAKHAIENHGGTIAVQSDLGHGSTFTIRLPQYASIRSIAG
ncbi:MAG: hypothetical protein C5B54_00790 [Acidobacteria bacterium]|nr:MAG: hypothetical protein C5B54_00790 [Acidobacteriota bacterium]